MNCAYLAMSLKLRKSRCRQGRASTSACKMREARTSQPKHLVKLQNQWNTYSHFLPTDSSLKQCKENKCSRSQTQNGSKITLSSHSGHLETLFHKTLSHSRHFEPLFYLPLTQYGFFSGWVLWVNQVPAVETHGWACSPLSSALATRPGETASQCEKSEIVCHERLWIWRLNTFLDKYEYSKLCFMESIIQRGMRGSERREHNFSQHWILTI